MVGRNVPPNDTTAPLANFWPVTTRVKLPTGIVVGSTAVTTGAGLVMVAVPVDVAVVSARLVACTWMVLGIGTVAGALIDSALGKSCLLSHCRSGFR